MAETSWDEVGRRFADLGRELQKTWQASASSSEAKAHLDDAGEKVRTALDDVAQTINKAAGSPEVREAVKGAGNGVAEALSATLIQVVEWIEQAPKTWPPAGDPSREPDPDRDDIQDAVIQDEPAGDEDDAEAPVTRVKTSTRSATEKASTEKASTKKATSSKASTKKASTKKAAGKKKA